ncbi:MAG: hypothetical protein HY896_13055, partial [Deltaproteobacteria bacterium]|nr:hypothetical protein [Deltaproteobacteria bacterium]
IIFFIIMRVISRKRRNPNASDVADVLERFVEGKSSEWEWDDFLSSPREQLFNALRNYLAAAGKSKVWIEKSSFDDIVATAAVIARTK